MAQTAGSGWSDYDMLNPRSGRVEPKSMYFERVDDVVIGCGIYRVSDAAEVVTARPRRPAEAVESSWPRLGAA